MKISTLIVGVLLAIGLLSFNSCKKGCTNPSAQNYDKAAREEDASCLYCDSVFISESTNSVSFQEENPSSVYYGNFVLMVSTQTDFYMNSGNACSKRNSSISCTASNVLSSSSEFVFTNQTSARLGVTARLLYYSPNTGEQLLDTMIQGIEIPPYSTFKPIYAIQTSCLQSFSSGSLYVNNISFTYL